MCDYIIYEKLFQYYSIFHWRCLLRFGLLVPHFIYKLVFWLLFVLQIIVEYNSQSTDDFIALADSIEEAHSDIVVEGVEIETDPGNFIVKDSEGQILDQGNTEKITTQRVLEVLESLGLSQGNSSQNAQDCVL